MCLSYLRLSRYTRTRYHFRALSVLDLAHSLISFISTLGHWSSWSVATSIHSRALGLRELVNQLGIDGGSIVPSLGIITKTWPHNQVVLLATIFLSINLILHSIVSWYMQRSDGYVTNFIWPYLHQFFIDSHGLNGYGKPLKRPFYRYQSRLEAISNGRDIRQINW